MLEIIFVFANIRYTTAVSEYVAPEGVVVVGYSQTNTTTIILISVIAAVVVIGMVITIIIFKKKSA